MENILYRVICVVVGYVFGLIQTSYIYGKMNHIDIRDYGSGNAGTTNAIRTLGKKAGLITFLGDIFKAIICSVLVYFVFKGIVNDRHFLMILRLYAGVGVILGHNFPFYMGFKGGKGVAASAGVVIGLFDYKIILIELALFIAIVAVTRYVSLGSLVITAGFFIEFVIFNELGIYGFHNNMQFTGNQKIETYIIVFFIGALAWFKHRTNIVRLLHGTGRKLGEKKEV